MKRWQSGWYNDRRIEGEEEEPEHRLTLGTELDLDAARRARARDLAAAALAREVVEQLMSAAQTTLDAQPFDLTARCRQA